MSIKTAKPGKPTEQTGISDLSATSTTAPWCADGTMGHMQAQGTPPVKLVRLADVLRWIMKTKCLPHEAAMRELCNAMPKDVMAALVTVQKGRFALPVELNCMFGYQSAKQVENKRHQHQQAAILQGLKNAQRVW